MATKKTKTSEPVKKDRSNLVVDERYFSGDDVARYRGMSEAEFEAKMPDLQDAIVARAVSQPETRAARTIQRLEGDLLEINSLADELRVQVKAVSGGNLGRAEAMLVGQAHVLDQLFSQLVMRSHGNMGAGYLPAAETYMKLALKAQSQCRATLETLAAIKNPPIVYARQANVTTGPQQINNGMTAPTRAREIENEQSKLLEAKHGERLDTGAQSAASGANQELATLVEVDRADVGCGQGKGGYE